LSFVFYLEQIFCPASDSVHQDPGDVKYVFDTNVLIDISSGAKSNLPGDAKIAVSALSLVEIAAPNHMSLSEAEDFIASLNVSELVPVTNQVARLAVELRKVQNLHALDACIGATACLMNATLVTNDQRLRRHPVLSTLPFPVPQQLEGETP
jgi:predicted nucleic acid-binding protein